MKKERLSRRKKRGRTKTNALCVYLCVRVTTLNKANNTTKKTPIKKKQFRLLNYSFCVGALTFNLYMYIGIDIEVYTCVYWSGRGIQKEYQKTRRKRKNNSQKSVKEREEKTQPICGSFRKTVRPSRSGHCTNASFKNTAPQSFALQSLEHPQRRRAL